MAFARRLLSSAVVAGALVCTLRGATTNIQVDQAGYLPGEPKLAMVVTQSAGIGPSHAFAVHRAAIVRLHFAAL